MIDTRTLALVVGCLSLAFGIWAATGAPSEVGLAAGALGLVAGLIALVPRGGGHPRGELAPALTQRSGHETNPPGSLDGTDTGADARTDTVSGTANRATPGYFDRDPVTDEPRSEPASAVAASEHGAMPAVGSAPSGTEEAGTDKDAGDPQRATPLTDPLTGLFSEEYLTVALEGRLASARRHLRPVALAVLEVTQGLPDTGSRPADAGLVAEAISNTVRDSDIACRLGDGTFGVILEDTPENGAVWTVERIRRNLVSTSGHHTLWAGVACYPAHAFDAPELMTQVQEALESAREWNQDRIEVAIAE